MNKHPSHVTDWEQLLKQRRLIGEIAVSDPVTAHGQDLIRIYKRDFEGEIFAEIVLEGFRLEDREFKPRACVIIPREKIQQAVIALLRISVGTN